MKLAKKVLAAVMAIAMIAALSAMAFAAAPAVNFEFGNVSNGTVKVNVYFDDAVGLKSWDVTINYDADVLTFKSMSKGADAKQVENTADNSFTDEKNTSEAGKILYSGYFKENLWDAKTFADNAADAEEAPVNINDKHFHAATITFTVNDTDKASTDLTAAVTTFGGVDTLTAGSATLTLKATPVPTESKETESTKEPEGGSVTAPVDKPTDKPTEKTTDDGQPTKGHNGKGNVNTGDNMALVAAGAVVILAGAAFVISKKKK